MQTNRPRKKQNRADGQILFCSGRVFLTMVVIMPRHSRHWLAGRHLLFQMGLTDWNLNTGREGFMMTSEGKLKPWWHIRKQSGWVKAGVNIMEPVQHCS